MGCSDTGAGQAGAGTEPDGAATWTASKDSGEGGVAME